MPTITLKEDPFLYRVEIPGEGEAVRVVEINLCSLAHEVRAAGERPTDEQVVAIVRTLARPGELMANLADHQVFAIGMAVLPPGARSDGHKSPACDARDGRTAPADEEEVHRRHSGAPPRIRPATCGNRRSVRAGQKRCQPGRTTMAGCDA